MNYKFKCTECGADRIEEVLPGVTQTSVVNTIIDIGSEVICEYGDLTTEGGHTDQIRYQCVECGQEVSLTELQELAQIECEDCGGAFDRKDIRPWKYEPSVKLCDSCHDARMEEEPEQKKKMKKMKKMKAYLVDVSLRTRVVIPANVDPESEEGLELVFTIAKPKFCDKINTEIGDNLEEIIHDDECPYGTFDGEN